MPERPLYNPTMRRAKIVCTLGPASNTENAVQALVDAGMDCARLNFSHGDHAGHQHVADLVRAAARKARRPVAILGDLSGPKMRVGRFADGPIVLVAGQSFTLTTEACEGDANRVSVTYKSLANDVKDGDSILLDDGLLGLRVKRVTGNDVVCEVETGGPLSNNKGLNLPGVELSTPALTDKDRLDLEFATQTLKVDYLALSFVRKPEDIEQAKALAGDTPVIAKIEKPEAVELLSQIADVADGMMVARGDLGVEMGPEKVPLIQKRIINEGNNRGKLVITATQMLDSMIRNPRPTRAEAADVANAVLDGTDAVMLSGETASGNHPVKAVAMMDAIVRDVESAWLKDRHSAIREPRLLGRRWGFANAAARGAALLSFALPLKAVVAVTRDGRTGNLLSEYRPRAPIVAITPDSRVASRLALAWGIQPALEVPPDDLEEALRISTALVVRLGLCKKGDEFALVLGWPTSSGTNTVKLHRV